MIPMHIGYGSPIGLRIACGVDLSRVIRESDAGLNRGESSSSYPIRSKTETCRTKDTLCATDQNPESDVRKGINTRKRVDDPDTKGCGLYCAENKITLFLQTVQDWHCAPRPLQGFAVPAD